MRTLRVGTTTPKFTSLQAIEANRAALLAWGINIDIYLGSKVWVTRNDEGRVVDALDAAAFAATYVQTAEDPATAPVGDLQSPDGQWWKIGVDNSGAPLMEPMT